MSNTSGKLSDFIEDRRLLKCEEVASLLNVSRSFAYSLMQSGQLPTVHLGRSVRVRQDDLEEFIHLNLVKG